MGALTESLTLAPEQVPLIKLTTIAFAVKQCSITHTHACTGNTGHLYLQTLLRACKGERGRFIHQLTDEERKSSRVEKRVGLLATNKASQETGGIKLVPHLQVVIK